MSKYQELIKSFDNIRKIANDFFVYGYKGRGDFSFISDRTYDNELRHIKSYLKNYVKTNQLKDKKTVAISSNTVHNSINPLFELFLSKSFTNVDCFLHFTILDLLADFKTRTLNEITNELSLNYDCINLDTMTIRNKLHEYVEMGIISLTKDSNKNLYALTKHIELDENIKDAISFFQNIMPAGYIMMNQVKDVTTAYLYKQVFFSHILDDEYVLMLLEAKKNNQTVVINQLGRYKDVQAIGVPKRIYHNMITGRRYVEIISANGTMYKVRIDKIMDVAISSEKVKEVKGKANKEFIELTLIITKEEEYVLERLYREVGKTSVESLENNLYKVRFESMGGLDLVPYIRTYFGRIVEMVSSDTFLIKKIKRDLKATLAYYKEGESNVS